MIADIAAAPHELIGLWRRKDGYVPWTRMILLPPSRPWSGGPGSPLAWPMKNWPNAPSSRRAASTTWSVESGQSADS